jgi:hypothetical protein
MSLVVHGQLALTVPQALAEGLAEGQEVVVTQTLEDQEVAVTQTLEDQKEGPSLAEDREGEERKTRASGCRPGR